MNIQTFRLIGLTLFLSSVLCPRSSVFAQGSLTPPGAPAPTMKTLAQVEPRTPIAGGTTAVTISQAGSYYLTGNITVASGDAITIATNSVTLDLMGFTISSTANPAAGSGIVINTLLKNITILNGGILGAVSYNGSTYTGAGFQNGINVASSSIAPKNVRVSGISVSGCTLNGISTGNVLQPTAAVDHCRVYTVGSFGIRAGSVSDCVASGCGGEGIGCFIASNSSAESTSSLTGISAQTAINCMGSSSTGTGLSADVATGCRGESGSGTGLSAKSANGCYGQSSGSGAGLDAQTATGCYATSSTGRGINAKSASNCYGVSTGGDGLLVITASNCYGSSSSGDGLNAISASNCYGVSNSGDGLAAQIAIGCSGDSSSGSGLFADLAIGCFGSPAATGHKYLSGIGPDS